MVIDAQYAAIAAGVEPWWIADTRASQHNPNDWPSRAADVINLDSDPLTDTPIETEEGKNEKQSSSGEEEKVEEDSSEEEFKFKEDETGDGIDDLTAVVDETMMIDAKSVSARSHDHDGDGEEDHHSRFVHDVGIASEPILSDQADSRFEEIAVADSRATAQEDAEAAADIFAKPAENVADDKISKTVTAADNAANLQNDDTATVEALFSSEDTADEVDDSPAEDAPEDIVIETAQESVIFDQTGSFESPETVDVIRAGRSQDLAADSEVTEIAAEGDEDASGFDNSDGSGNEENEENENEESSAKEEIIITTTNKPQETEKTITPDTGVSGVVISIDGDDSASSQVSDNTHDSTGISDVTEVEDGADNSESVEPDNSNDDENDKEETSGEESSGKEKESGVEESKETEGNTDAGSEVAIGTDKQDADSFKASDDSVAESISVTLLVDAADDGALKSEAAVSLEDPEAGVVDEDEEDVSDFEDVVAYSRGRDETKGSYSRRTGDAEAGDIRDFKDIVAYFRGRVGLKSSNLRTAGDGEEDIRTGLKDAFVYSRGPGGPKGSLKGPSLRRPGDGVAGNNRADLKNIVDYSESLGGPKSFNLRRADDGEAGDSGADYEDAAAYSKDRGESEDSNAGRASDGEASNVPNDVGEDPVAYSGSRGGSEDSKSERDSDGEASDVSNDVGEDAVAYSESRGRSKESKSGRDSDGETDGIPDDVEEDAVAYSKSRGGSEGSKSRTAGDGDVDDVLDDIEFSGVGIPTDPEENREGPDTPEGSAAAKPKPKPKPKKPKGPKKRNRCIGKQIINLC